MHLLLLTLFLLAAPGVAPGADRAHARAPAAPGDAAARQLVEGVVARYRSLAAYRLEGEAAMELGGSQGSNRSVTSVRFLVRRPGHLASEVRNAQITTTTVADGESLWTAVPELSQYRVQPLTAVRAAADSLSFARQMDPAGDYARLLQGVTSLRGLGRDTVRTARGVVSCERVALTVGNPAAAGPGVRLLPRVLWVDPLTHLVLRDSVRIEQQHPQLGLVHSISTTRIVWIEADPPLAAATFRFRPPAGMRRVRTFMQSSPEHAAMEGQPAQDFTLETLAESKPVRLSDLKGKVVVLDFWATWCGPCRGWLPIVAKAHREYASKGVVVYAVNERETEPMVRAYLAKQKLDLPVLMDLSGTVGTNFHASAIPLTVIVGRNGSVVRVLVGLHEEDDLRDALHDAGVD